MENQIVTDELVITLLSPSKHIPFDHFYQKALTKTSKCQLLQHKCLYEGIFQFTIDRV